MHTAYITFIKQLHWNGLATIELNSENDMIYSDQGIKRLFIMRVVWSIWWVDKKFSYRNLPILRLASPFSYERFRKDVH